MLSRPEIGVELRHSRSMDTTTPPPAKTPQLTRSRLMLDGRHSTTLLTAAVRRGEMLRLRRGVYVDVQDWCSAPPWERHLLITGAAALWHPESIFCRQTALALHGVPLLRSPAAVQIRTSRPQQVGRRRSSPLTGRAPGKVLQEMLARGTGPEGRALTRRDLVGLSTQRILTPDSAPEPSILHGPPVGGVEAVQVEPLDAVVADTVPRLPLEDAVVVLDALRAGRHRAGAKVAREHFALWEQLIPTHRAARLWDTAWRLSDAGAESPGESLSRVRMAEGGFLLPESQAVFDLPGGGRARVDFWWPELGLVGEFDGKVKYTRARQLSGVDVAEVVHAEKVREDGLRSLGLGVVRWCWQDLWPGSRVCELLLTAGVPRV